jgi:hypothetical protein
VALLVDNIRCGRWRSCARVCTLREQPRPASSGPWLIEEFPRPPGFWPLANSAEKNRIVAGAQLTIGSDAQVRSRFPLARLARGSIVR